MAEPHASSGGTKEYNIVILGSKHVGKTSTISHFVHDRAISDLPASPSGKDDYRKLCNVDDTPCMLRLEDTFPWDTDEMSAWRDEQTASADAIVIMYSVTGRATFKDVEGIKWEAERICSLKERESMPPVILVGNKIDARKEEEKREDAETDALPAKVRVGPSDQSSSALVTHEEGAEVAGQWKFPFFEISAKDGTNLEKPFCEAVREIRKRESVVEEMAEAQRKLPHSLKEYLFRGQGKLKEPKGTRPPIVTKAKKEGTGQGNED